jgi:hypothetical protein
MINVQFGAEAVELMLSAFRSLAQPKETVSELLAVTPSECR